MGKLLWLRNFDRKMIDYISESIFMQGRPVLLCNFLSAVTKGTSNISANERYRASYIVTLFLKIMSIANIIKSGEGSMKSISASYRLSMQDLISDELKRWLQKRALAVSAKIISGAMRIFVPLRCSLRRINAFVESSSRINHFTTTEASTTLKSINDSFLAFGGLFQRYSSLNAPSCRDYPFFDMLAKPFFYRALFVRLILHIGKLFSSFTSPKINIAYEKITVKAKLPDL